jgi:hypothetical protein
MEPKKFSISWLKRGLLGALMVEFRISWQKIGISRLKCETSIGNFQMSFRKLRFFSWWFWSQENVPAKIIIIQKISEKEFIHEKMNSNSCIRPKDAGFCVHPAAFYDFEKFPRPHVPG